MKIYYTLLGASLVFNLIACSTSEEKNQQAQAQYTQEKTKTLQEYKTCIKDSAGTNEKLVQCEALLKAVGAMEGAIAPAPTEEPALEASVSTPAQVTDAPAEPTESTVPDQVIDMPTEVAPAADQTQTDQ